MHPWISSELYAEHRRQLLEQAAAYHRWTEGHQARQAKAARWQWRLQSPIARRHLPALPTLPALPAPTTPTTPTTLTICR
jgi:hypothetical protein